MVIYCCGLDFQIHRCLVHQSAVPPSTTYVVEHITPDDGQTFSFNYNCSILFCGCAAFSRQDDVKHSSPTISHHIYIHMQLYPASSAMGCGLAQCTHSAMAAVVCLFDKMAGKIDDVSTSRNMENNVLLPLHLGNLCVTHEYLQKLRLCKDNNERIPHLRIDPGSSSIHSPTKTEADCQHSGCMSTKQNWWSEDRFPSHPTTNIGDVCQYAACMPSIWPNSPLIEDGTAI